MSELNFDDRIICYKFASRSRPDKFFKRLQNIRDMAQHKNYFVYCTFDIDDTTMNNEGVIKHLTDLATGFRLYWTFGASKNKVDAINRDLDKMPNFDVLVNMSDDMAFIQSGFDLTILRDLYHNYPNGDACVMYWDGGEETKNVMTLSVMGRPYFKRFGYIYFQGYESLWCDVEATNVAHQLGRLVYSRENIVVHEHPANGYGQTDQQYLKTEDPAVFKRDKATHEVRKAKDYFLGDMLLSILICHLPARKEMLHSLTEELNRQREALPEYYRDKIEVIIDPYESSSTGAKRNALLHSARGRFIVFIDDDDKVHAEYIHRIMAAIVTDPTVDCIGMLGIITTNGADERSWSISMDHGKWNGNEYQRWYEDNNVYYRTPNHISPVRREIAMLGMFPDKNHGEDYDYSMAILPYLKRETKIHKQIYHYDYRSK